MPKIKVMRTKLLELCRKCLRSLFFCAQGQNVCESFVVETDSLDEYGTSFGWEGEVKNIAFH